MFSKIKCNKCQKTYDDALNECPHCHEKNEGQSKEFKNIQMIHFGKQLAIFLTGWLGFKVIAEFFKSIILTKVYETDTIDTIREYATNIRTSMLLNAAVYLITGLILALILFTDITKILKSFKNWKAYVAGAACFGAIIAFNLIYNIILRSTGALISDNNNETAIISVSTAFPLISLFIFGLVGPIVEELTYRVGLFSFSKRISKWFAYPITIIVFTLIHFDFEAATITNELLNIPFYAFAAFAFTWTYDHFGFAASATAHITNNFISLAFIKFITNGHF